MAGSFEYALDYLIDKEVDLTGIARRYCNDETGAPAYDPAVMLKIVLLACSRGIVSSRAIERVCRENVLFMAISGDSAPQFTTIAKFVRELGEEISAIFTQVPMRGSDAQRRSDRTPAERSEMPAGVSGKPRRTPLRQRGGTQEQRHRQRQRQDGHRQGGDPGLHGGRCGRWPIADHRGGPGARLGQRAKRAAADGQDDRVPAYRSDDHHRGCGLPQRGEPAGAARRRRTGADRRRADAPAR